MTISNFHYILFILFTAMLSESCTSPENSGTKHSPHAHHETVTGHDLEHKVLQTHDSAMVLMQEVSRLTTALQERQARTDSLKQPELFLGLRQDLHQLEQAEEAMMAWMRGYRPDTLETLHEAAATSYLSRQHESIRQLLQHTRQVLDTLHRRTE